MNKYLVWAQRSPVVVLDILKYAAALAVLFGLPIPPGVDVAMSALIVAALSLVTRQLVTPNGAVAEQVDEALNTPAPEVVPIPELPTDEADAPVEP